MHATVLVAIIVLLIIACVVIFANTRKAPQRKQQKHRVHQGSTPQQRNEARSRLLRQQVIQQNTPQRAVATADIATHAMFVDNNLEEAIIYGIRALQQTQHDTTEQIHRVVADVTDINEMLLTQDREAINQQLFDAAVRASLHQLPKATAHTNKVDNVVETMNLIADRDMAVHIDRAQQVHDSNIHTELTQQYNALVEKNKGHAPMTAFDEALEYINLHEPLLAARLRNMKQNITELTAPAVGRGDKAVHIDQFVADVWNKVKQNENMKLTFADAAKSCVEQNGVVCQTGIVTKLWGSFAHMDPDDAELGIVKTKEQGKAEVMLAVGAAVRRLTESATEEENKAYNDNVDSPLRDMMVREIGKIINATNLPEQTKNQMLQECIASV